MDKTLRKKKVQRFADLKLSLSHRWNDTKKYHEMYIKEAEAMDDDELLREIETLDGQEAELLMSHGL